MLKRRSLHQDSLWYRSMFLALFTKNESFFNKQLQEMFHRQQPSQRKCINISQAFRGNINNPFLQGKSLFALKKMDRVTIESLA